MSKLATTLRTPQTAESGAGAVTDPIQRRKLYQEVVDRLLTRIRGGEFPPGEQLPSERQLMEVYGVGRPAIREALLTLQRMGHISITHGDRARVMQISADTAMRQIGEIARYMLETSSSSLEDLKEARLFFEVGLVRLAANKATAMDIERLRNALEEHRAVLNNVDHYLDKDMAFHRVIASISGNPVLQAVSKAMLEWLRQFHIGLLRAPGAERIGVSEHTRIFNCITKGDAEGAARAMTSHLTRANKLYTRLGLSADEGK